MSITRDVLGLLAAHEAGHATRPFATGDWDASSGVTLSLSAEGNLVLTATTDASYRTVRYTGVASRGKAFVQAVVKQGAEGQVGVKAHISDITFGSLDDEKIFATIARSTGELLGLYEQLNNVSTRLDGAYTPAAKTAGTFYRFGLFVDASSVVGRDHAEAVTRSGTAPTHTSGQLGLLSYQSASSGAPEVSAFFAMADRNLVVSGLPTGWKARAGGITAVESGGTATLDLLTATFPAVDLEILDGSDVVQETFSGEVWGGDSFTFSQAASFVELNGRIDVVSVAERGVLTVAPFVVLNGRVDVVSAAERGGLTVAPFVALNGRVDVVSAAESGELTVVPLVNLNGRVDIFSTAEGRLAIPLWAACADPAPASWVGCGSVGAGLTQVSSGLLWRNNLTYDEGSVPPKPPFAASTVNIFGGWNEEDAKLTVKTPGASSPAEHQAMGGALYMDPYTTVNAAQVIAPDIAFRRDFVIESAQMLGQHPDAWYDVMYAVEDDAGAKIAHWWVLHNVGTDELRHELVVNGVPGYAFEDGLLKDQFEGEYEYWNFKLSVVDDVIRCGEFRPTIDKAGRYPNPPAWAFPYTSHTNVTSAGRNLRPVIVIPENGEKWIDDIRVYKNHTITVQGMPAGSTAEVLNSGGSVVASATPDAAGTALIDVTSLSFPYAGHATVRVREVDGAEHEISPADGVWGGDVYEFAEPDAWVGCGAAGASPWESC